MKTLKTLRKEILKGWGKKHKDYSTLCGVCQAYRALEDLEDLYDIYDVDIKRYNKRHDVTGDILEK